MDCLFCRIIEKEVPAAEVYEDDHVLAVLDVHPRAPGHTLVLPKVHAESLLNLPEEEIAPVFRAVRAVTEKLGRTLSPDGFTIGINHGKTAGQEVEHLHIHIIPRWLNDGGSSIHSVVSNPPEESLEQVAKKINTQ